MKKILFVILLLVCNFAHAETITVTATTDGNIYALHANYATARDTVTGGSAATTNLAIGQALSGDYYVYRSFASFVLPSMESVTACTLYVNGDIDNSTTDFEVYIHTSTYTAIQVADYELFDGRQAAGVHNGSILNNTWNSSSYSAGWNTLVFNAAGLNSIATYSGGTIKIALISKEDFSNSAPSDAEFLSFDSSADGGTEPYLSITHTSRSRRNILYKNSPNKVYDTTRIPAYKP